MSAQLDALVDAFWALVFQHVPQFLFREERLGVLCGAYQFRVVCRQRKESLDRKFIRLAGQRVVGYFHVGGFRQAEVNVESRMLVDDVPGIEFREAFVPREMQAVQLVVPFGGPVRAQVMLAEGGIDELEAVGNKVAELVRESFYQFAVVIRVDVYKLSRLLGAFVRFGRVVNHEGLLEIDVPFHVTVGEFPSGNENHGFQEERTVGDVVYADFPAIEVFAVLHMRGAAHQFMHGKGIVLVEVNGVVALRGGSHLDDEVLGFVQGYRNGEVAVGIRVKCLEEGFLHLDPYAAFNVLRGELEAVAARIFEIDFSGDLGILRFYMVCHFFTVFRVTH